MFIITWIISVYVLTIIRFYLLRNLYSILSNPLVSNKKIGQISIVKRLVSPLISHVLIISISGVVSVLCSIHGVVIFFDLYFFEEEAFQVVNISFVVCILIGCLIGIGTVVVDFIVNWKVIKGRGLLSFLRFDDPFKVRIDLLSMSILLIIAIIHASLDSSYQRIFFFLESLIFVFICGGFGLIFEILNTIKRWKNKETLSELEIYLGNENFVKLFKEFSSKEFSLENIQFYEKLTQLKAQYGSSSIDKQTLQQIEDEYIAINSKFELNIASATRNSFSELKRNSCSSSEEFYSLFHGEIIANLNDTFGRLLHTEEFEKWYEIFEIQHKNSV